MALQQDFQSSQEQVKNLKARPSNEELLQLYALYKQATTGDVEGKRPGMLAIKDRAKWDAWSSIKGKNKDSAMTEYVSLVKKLISSYGV